MAMDSMQTEARGIWPPAAFDWQQVQHDGYNPYAADVWSFGLMIFTLCSGLKPFASPSPGDPVFRAFVKSTQPKAASSDIFGIHRRRQSSAADTQNGSHAASSNSQHTSRGRGDSAWHWPQCMSVELQTLVHACLQLDPAQRPSMQEVCNYEWLRGSNDVGCVSVSSQCLSARSAGVAPPGSEQISSPAGAGSGSLSTMNSGGQEAVLSETACITCKPDGAGAGPFTQPCCNQLSAGAGPGQCATALLDPHPPPGTTSPSASPPGAPAAPSVKTVPHETAPYATDACVHVTQSPAEQEGAPRISPLPIISNHQSAEFSPWHSAPPAVPHVGLPDERRGALKAPRSGTAAGTDKLPAVEATSATATSTKGKWRMRSHTKHSTRVAAPLVRTPPGVGPYTGGAAAGHTASIRPVRLSTEDEAAPLPDFSMGMRLPVSTQGRQAASNGHDDAASLALSDATSHRTQQGVLPRAMSSASLGSTMSLFRGAIRGPLSPSTFRHSPSGQRSGGAAAAQFSFPALVHSTSSGTMASGSGVRSPLASPSGGWGGGSVHSESRSPVHSSAHEGVRPSVS